MKTFKKFVDQVMHEVDINEMIERRKCRATGKVRFNTKGQAKFFMYWLKWRYGKNKSAAKKGKRSHRSVGKKPEQRRVYYCEHCDGYHLTKLPPREFERPRKRFR